MADYLIKFNKLLLNRLQLWLRLRLHGIQRGYLFLDGVDAVAPCLVLGVQRGWVVGQRFACGLRLGILDGLVVVAAKMRLQR